MPIHSWNDCDACIFHDFHQAWTVELRHALNGGVLPAGCFALIGRSTAEASERISTDAICRTGRAVRVTEIPPRARIVRTADADVYASRANRIVIQRGLCDVAAVVEIVSPGNKGSRSAVDSFVDKAAELLRQGINLLIVDLFPPSVRDPQGIHKAIWDEFLDEPFELPADKPLTVAAYAAAVPRRAYVEPVAVGDPLPSLPIFLEPGIYVPAPLEVSYQTTWLKCPGELRELVESSSPP